MYTYKHIIFYILKLSLMLTSLFIDTILCLTLACLITNPKFGLEFGLFVKINEHKNASSQVEPTHL